MYCLPQPLIARNIQVYSITIIKDWIRGTLAYTQKHQIESGAQLTAQGKLNSSLKDCFLSA